MVLFLFCFSEDSVIKETCEVMLQAGLLKLFSRFINVSTCMPYPWRIRFEFHVCKRIYILKHTYTCKHGKTSTYPSYFICPWWFFPLYGMYTHTVSEYTCTYICTVHINYPKLIVKISYPLQRFPYGHVCVAYAKKFFCSCMHMHMYMHEHRYTSL